MTINAGVIGGGLATVLQAAIPGRRIKKSDLLGLSQLVLARSPCREFTRLNLLESNELSGGGDDYPYGVSR